jgi:hypothetical protein
MTAKPTASTIIYDADADILAIGAQSIPVFAFTVGGFTLANVKTLYTMVDAAITALPDAADYDADKADVLTAKIIGERLDADKVQSYLERISKTAAAAKTVRKIERLQAPVREYNTDNREQLSADWIAVLTAKTVLLDAESIMLAHKTALGAVLDIPPLQIGFIPAADADADADAVLAHYYVDEDTLKTGKLGTTRQAKKRVYPVKIAKTVVFTVHKGIDALSVKITGTGLTDKGVGSWTFIFTVKDKAAKTGKGKTANAAYSEIIGGVVKAWSKTPDCALNCNVPDVFDLVDVEPVADADADADAE